jgi:serine/threonine protein kinase
MDEIKEYKKNYILLEFATKGNLLDYVNLKRKGFNEKISKIIFAKILKAVEILHELGICIKKIDLQNILLDGENYDIKLSNFELSSFFINKNREKKLLKEKVNTFQNVAPEVIKGIPYDGEKADIFSFGVLLLSLMTGYYGLKGTKTNHSSLDINEKLYKFIKNNKIDSYWKLLEKSTGINFSSEFKKLFIKLVAINPKERPTIEEIINDEWMKEINNLSENELKNYEQELINELKSRNEILNELKLK